MGKKKLKSIYSPLHFVKDHTPKRKAHPSLSKTSHSEKKTVFRAPAFKQLNYTAKANAFPDDLNLALKQGYLNYNTRSASSSFCSQIKPNGQSKRQQSPARSPLDNISTEYYPQTQPLSSPSKTFSQSSLGTLLLENSCISVEESLIYKSSPDLLSEENCLSGKFDYGGLNFDKHLTPSKERTTHDQVNFVFENSIRENRNSDNISFILGEISHDCSRESSDIVIPPSSETGETFSVVFEKFNDTEISQPLAQDINLNSQTPSRRLNSAQNEPLTPPHTVQQSKLEPEWDIMLSELDWKFKQTHQHLQNALHGLSKYSRG